MAKDVITRFKLETTQYDSKIKKSAKELSDFGKTATAAGKDFQQFTKGNVDAARALGTMATSTNSAKDKLKELVGAFNETAKAYNSLTKEQQQSDFAKALSTSLTQLQQRIRDTKQEMLSITNSSGGGGLFGGGKFDGMLQVFGGNMMTKAASLAAQFASEIGDCVKQGVELARQGEGVRKAFERLGRGDILDGLREATHGTVTDLELMKAAVKFSDFRLPLEELGTMLAFAQQKAKDTGQSVDYMVDSIVTGLGRKSLMILDNLGLSAAEIKEKMAETGDMTKAVGAIIREQMAKAGDYVETAADRATQANVNLQNKMEELGRKLGPLQEASNNFWTSMKISILDIIGGPLATLLNQLTEAGRMMNQYNNNGGSGKVNQQLNILQRVSPGKRENLYNQQVEKYWRYINYRKDYMKERQQWVNSGDENVRQGLLKRQNAMGGVSNPGVIQSQIDAAMKMLSEYQKGAQSILNPTTSTPPSQTTSTTTTTTSSSKSLSKDKDDFVEIIGLIPMAEEEVKSLQQQIRSSWDEGEIATLNAQLEKATENLQRLKNIQAETPEMKMEKEIFGVPTDAPLSVGDTNMGEQMVNDLSTSLVDAADNMDITGFTKKLQEALVDGASDMDLSEYLDYIRDQIGEQIDEEEWPSIKLAIETGDLKTIEKFRKKLQDSSKKTEEGWKGAAGSIGQLGSALQKVEDPGVKAVGTVIEAVASAALGFAQASKGPFTSPWEWIAFAASGLATMITMITTIHSATGLATGGFVPGNSYSGDNMAANGGGLYLNAGELVLNHAQQGALASQLEGGGLQNLQLETRISGEDIRLVLNNNGRRTGKGEFVQSQNYG